MSIQSDPFPLDASNVAHVPPASGVYELIRLPCDEETPSTVFVGSAGWNLRDWLSRHLGSMPGEDPVHGGAGATHFRYECVDTPAAAPLRQLELLIGYQAAHGGELPVGNVALSRRLASPVA